MFWAKSNACQYRRNAEIMFELLCVLLCAIIIQGKCEGAGSPFVMEPGNITITEGESTKLNCTMAEISEDIAIWVINGLEYYWSDFANTEVYSFDLRDNSLTIHNSPRILDGTSFQCVLDNYESCVGYLTVLSLSSAAPTSTSLISTSTAVSGSLIHTFSSSPTGMLILTTTTTTDATTYRLHNTAIILGTIVGAIVFSLLSIMCCIAFTLLQRSCTSKLNSSSATPEDGFHMDQNVLYLATKDIKTGRNSAYIYTYDLSKSP